MKLHHKKFLPMISALVDGELEENARHRVERHLASCRECSEVLEDFRRLKETGAAVKSYPINSYYLTRIKAYIEKEPEIPRDASTIEAKLFGPLLALLVILVIIMASLSEQEKASAEDYLYFGGQRTMAEQQLLSRMNPISKEEVLLLTVSTRGGEEGDSR